MARMSDVASLAGVSIATVSHVLNGTRTVAEPTRQRVQYAIAATGYRRNAAARALVTASTGTIGLAISSATNPYFGELVRAVETQARAAGLALILGDTHDNCEIEFDVIEHLVGRQVDGLILAPAAGSEHVSLPYLQRRDVPVVLVDRRADIDCDQVVPEGVAATESLVFHLADLGHRRIGLVSALPGLTSSADRELGYRKAVGERGLDDDPGLVVTGNSSIDGARAATTALLRAPRPPTALVVANNAMTIGALHAMRDLRLRVPEDVALVSYDDFDWADVVQPRLTCVAQDCVTMGREAVALMVKRIGGSTAPAEYREIPTSFKHRNSCGCPDDEPGA